MATQFSILQHLIQKLIRQQLEVLYRKPQTVAGELVTWGKAIVQEPPVVIEMICRQIYFEAMQHCLQGMLRSRTAVSIHLNAMQTVLQLTRDEVLHMVN